MPSDEDRAMAMGNMQKKFEVHLHGFRVMRVDRETDVQTDKLQYFATLTR